MFSFVGYEYHLDSALVKSTQERWLKLQDFILRLKSKRVLTARCLMSLIGLLASTEKMVPEGRLHMRPFQFHLKEHWRYPQSLDNLLPWTETIVGHLDWWQNPSNVMKGADLHPKDHSIQLFTDASNEGWGAHLDQNSTKGRQYLTRDAALTAANALVGSRLDYCNSLFRGLSVANLRKLQCIQNSLASICLQNHVFLTPLH